MAQPTTPQTYLALLRGINVGGKNILPMKDLAAIFHDAGCRDVRTFIQSGNVLFVSAKSDEHKLSILISAEITNRFGYRIPVVLRTLAELQAVVAANPFLAAGVAEKAMHVYFLRETPTPDAIAALDAARSLPDTFAAVGREIYLNMPNGMARTKLTNAYFDSRLKTISTARNWNTVTKLLALMQA